MGPSGGVGGPLCEKNTQRAMSVKHWGDQGERGYQFNGKWTPISPLVNAQKATQAIISGDPRRVMQSRRPCLAL